VEGVEMKSMGSGWSRQSCQLYERQLQNTFRKLLIGLLSNFFFQQLAYFEVDRDVFRRLIATMSQSSCLKVSFAKFNNWTNALPKQ